MSISAAEYLRRSQSIANANTLDALANEVMIKNESTLKLLKEQDLLQGDIYGDDTFVEYRSPAYSLFKASMNPLAHGSVDLILTGKFVDAMFLAQPKGNVFHFGNSDSKAADLTAKYGKGIFGLNSSVFNKYQIEILSPQYIYQIKNKAKIG